MALLGQLHRRRHRRRGRRRAALLSTQVYEFRAAAVGGEPGEHALVSHGPEWVDLDVPFERAIAGGYGRFRNADGEVAQTRVGFNQTQCENYTFDFKLRTQTRSWR
jgi:mannose/cellobiose epimerase-like protein (N-acyl-D-glucosamine 2-epimerase family)